MNGLTFGCFGLAPVYSTADDADCIASIFVTPCLLAV